MCIMPVTHSAVSTSMEHVEYEPEFNPEALTNYYSSGVQIGRITDPDVKYKITKAKNHLSALGWTFFYIWKKSTRRELRYRSPAGKTYSSLRTACQSLISPKDEHDDNHDLDVEGSSIIEEITEQETKSVKNDESVSNNRPKKRIRIEDVESSYFQQQQREESAGNSIDLGIVDDEKKQGNLKIRQRKCLPKIKKLIGKNRNQKRIRKVKPNLSKGRNRCLLSLLIQRKIVLRGSRVSYLHRLDDHVMKQGRVYEEGIQCDCCNLFFLMSKFEFHAGSTYRRPSARIFLDDGRSLLDCQTQLTNLGNEIDHNTVTTTNSTELSSDNDHDNHVKGLQDEFCSFCNDGGELLLCDSCTSSYHSSCIGLSRVPDSEYWFCPNCCCGICHQHDHGQINCRQCERQFHIDCLKKTGVSVSSDSANIFCSERCESIYSGLMAISGISIPLTMENLSWSLLNSNYNSSNNIKEEYGTEIYGKLNSALDAMHECFEPVKHPWSNNDLVEDVIFSRSSKKSNFRGFFTAVLERDEEVATVVTVRVHGCKAAEIPFVATRFQYRRLGMCRILMDEVERKLGELGVERIVLPAVPEMLSTWTEAFGFKTMTDSERLSLVDCKFLDFPGTVKCQKILKKM